MQHWSSPHSPLPLLSYVPQSHIIILSTRLLWKHYFLLYNCVINSYSFRLFSIKVFPSIPTHSLHLMPAPFLWNFYMLLCIKLFSFNHHFSSLYSETIKNENNIAYFPICSRRESMSIRVRHTQCLSNKPLVMT